MKKRRSRRARSALFLVITALFSLAVVLFPPGSRHASAQNGKKGAKPAAAAIAAANADAGVQAEAGAETKPAASKKDKDKDKEEKAADDDAMKTLPQGKGLPVLIHTAVFFLELKAFDDNKSEFECTTDVRLSWHDLRHAYDPAEVFRGYKEWRGKAADEQIEKMWQPSLEVTNRVEAPSYTGRRVRIYPDGKVELMTRTTAKHKAKVESESFPFDRQYLRLELLSREQTRDEVLFSYDKNDVGFSRAAESATLDGWRLGLVELRREVVAGWNGDRYSGVTASLSVDRDATSAFTSIFIPLMASLLIPLLAIWMNRANDEGFDIEAFELANMGIGGLFSVIALSFAIYSSFGLVAGTDNTVTRLFGLNYACIGIALGIVVFLFQYNIPLKLFGPHVHKELFKFLCWALPLVSFALSVAFILVAAA